MSSMFDTDYRVWINRDTWGTMLVFRPAAIEFYTGIEALNDARDAVFPLTGLRLVFTTPAGGVVVEPTLPDPPLLEEPMVAMPVGTSGARQEGMLFATFGGLFTVGLGFALHEPPAAGPATMVGDQLDALDIFYGGAGRDSILGSLGTDFAIGWGGHDTLRGRDGEDSLMGDAGNDLLNGGLGHDSLHGGTGHDTLQGADGNDLLMGEAGNDLLQGADGNDLIYGDAGADTLQGGEGRDVLVGGAGADRLVGGDGNDTIYADAGLDVVVDGAGQDEIRTSYRGSATIRLTDDGEADRLVLVRKHAGAAPDRVTGFAPEDRLAFDVPLQGLGGAVFRSVAEVLSDWAPAHGSGPMLVYETSTGRLLFDFDATGDEPSEVVAVFLDRPAILESQVTLF